MGNPFVHVELATTDLDKAKSFASWENTREFCSARPPGPANGERFSSRFKYL